MVQKLPFLFAEIHPFYFTAYRAPSQLPFFYLWVDTGAMLGRLWLEGSVTFGHHRAGG